MFLIIHAGHLNLAHYNFAVTPQLRLMRFMLNIMHLMPNFVYSTAMACTLSLPARLQSG